MVLTCFGFYCVALAMGVTVMAVSLADVGSMTMDSAKSPQAAVVEKRLRVSLHLSMHPRQVQSSPKLQ